MNLNFLYSWVKNAEMYVSDQRGGSGYLHQYFEVDGGFTTAAIIAAVAAVVFLILFYGCIGNFVHRLSTKLCWWVAVVLVGLSTIGVTQFVVVGSNESNSGFFKSAENHWEESVSKDIPIGAEQDRQTAQDYKAQLKKDMGGMRCEVVRKLHVTNVLFSLVLFIVLSLIFKRFTVHAKRIPF